jgi:hypothetical protein
MEHLLQGFVQPLSASQAQLHTHSEMQGPSLVPRRLEVALSAFEALREVPVSPNTFWQCSAVSEPASNKK